MKMIQCPICGKQGELNTFCAECDWFLIETFDAFSLSPINEDKLQELNSVFLKFQNHRKNEYAKNVLQNSQAQQSEIRKSIDKLEKQNIAILNELNALKDSISGLLNNEKLSSPNSEKETTEPIVEIEKENKPLIQEKRDIESKSQNDRENFISSFVSNVKQKITNDFIFQTSNLTIGSSYFFGSYPQDRDGTRKAIEWCILAKENNKLLLISKHALDCKPYNTREQGITWEDCTLRYWLNNDFINSAFTVAEKKKIDTVTVSAENNPRYKTDSGIDTSDKVFLLSIAEVKKYLTTDGERQCKPTEYAGEKNNYPFIYNENCWWWLRSPGKRQYFASCISDSGYIDNVGFSVSDSHNAVRPALWIDLNI